MLAFDPAGSVLQRISEDEDGRRFTTPTGIAIDPKARILYVVNAGTSSISRLPLAPKNTPKKP